MRATPRMGVTLLVLLLSDSPSYSQSGDGEVYWHLDPSVETCSMVIDPSLTQSQWKTFTREAGALSGLKSLASAEPLGKFNFVLAVDYSITPVDQRDPAWINTFTHPDADCPLGDRIELPMLRGWLGVSRTVDVSGYWTTAPGANYGLLGGELRYAFRAESPEVPAAAVSASFTRLTGVPDFDVSVYSVRVLASKRYGRLSPYLGVTESLVIGTETTAKVDLESERLALTHGFLGAAYSTWKLRAAAEYDVAAVSTFAFSIGFRPGAHAP